MKRQKDRTDELKDKLPRFVSAQHAIGEQWRNNSRKNEETEQERKQHPVVDVLVMEVKSNGIKNNIAQEPGMLGP